MLGSLFWWAFEFLPGLCVVYEVYFNIFFLRFSKRALTFWVMYFPYLDMILLEFLVNVAFDCWRLSDLGSAEIIPSLLWPVGTLQFLSSCSTESPSRVWPSIWITVFNKDPREYKLLKLFSWLLSSLQKPVSPPPAISMNSDLDLLILVRLAQFIDLLYHPMTQNSPPCMKPGQFKGLPNFSFSQHHSLVLCISTVWKNFSIFSSVF